MLFARIALLHLLSAALALAVPTPAAGELPSIPATQSQVQPRAKESMGVNDQGEVVVNPSVPDPDYEVVPVRRDDVRDDGKKSMGDTVQAIQHPSWQITRRQVGELVSDPAAQDQVQPRDDAADKGYEEAEDKRIKEPSNELGSKEQVQRRGNDHANVNDSGEVLVPPPVPEPDSEVVPVRRDDVRDDGKKSMGDTVQAIQHPSWQITRRQGGETDAMVWDNTDNVASRPPRGRSVRRWDEDKDTQYENAQADERAKYADLDNVEVD